MEKTIIDLLKLGFDLDDFYSISIYPPHREEQILLQGEPTPEKLLKYTNLGYTFENINGRLRAFKNKLVITLY